MKRYLLGFDIGSSSIKAALVDAETGKTAAHAFSPETEMPISSPRPGWAEQHPESWWQEVISVSGKLRRQLDFKPEEIAAIGISYQMHGLVLVDKDQQVLRPSIIWCDSRAVAAGNQAFGDLGKKFCLEHFLNSPGNFTASKLKWVRENEPLVYEKTDKFMLPGDFIAMKMSGEACTTYSGLSEGILWDFLEEKPAQSLLDHYGIDARLIATPKPTFSIQGHLQEGPAELLGLKAGIPIAYRAGDQPNNAFSLNVLEPGEVAATAGTSGVVYSISDKNVHDKQSRVNPFAHVNHTPAHKRLGILLCINGTGILNSWVRKNFGSDLSYEEMNLLASRVPPGADGVSILPFGNGAERMLENRYTGSVISGLDFNNHERGHVFRAAQEGIAFAFRYGMELMQQLGTDTRVIRAGNANMFLSPVFRETLSSLTGATIELYDTDGAAGAARGAGVGAGIYSSPSEAGRYLQRINLVAPQQSQAGALEEAYQAWKLQLLEKLQA
ncbi:xylulokinase [Anseongella ginsenosidimutans]|uniref:Xylulokinase n=1 Tax=Anseongella ginsenosidimutans TaxID=496056 RepID=A0A4R3KQ40_9SPHI|nr:FGGY family carbohydrate kinase [Anseongella ginsenosidimutans]QEC53695.1 carbohydrate kinase [Anseongella ginsenosidimutans]TCS86056.1 xylulokinase [Anseongella ginsenosidimutans]